MKNSIKKSIVLSLIMTLFLCGNVYARDEGAYQDAKRQKVDSVLLPFTEKHSIGYSENGTRSQALSGATCEITNQGSGIIGVYAQTRMHIPVDWAYLTIYLEQWDEELRSWQIKETIEKEFWPEDDEDGKLTTVTLSEKISTQPSGYYYRVRAIHELEHGDNYEVKVSKTDGIMITSAP